MKTWKQACKDAVLSGSFASLSSLLAMAWRGRAENGSACSTLNAPSHWIWGEPALRQDAPSLRYTALGLLIHHLSAGFWAILHEKALAGKNWRRGAPTRLRDAALTSAVAALVDLRLVPHRLSPGFQKRLSSPSLTLVYTLFGLGLALGSFLSARRPKQAADTPPGPM